MLQKQTVPLTDIRVPKQRAKTLDPDKRDTLGEDILEQGMTTPIQVRTDGAGFVLVEGLHRLEAMRALGETEIEAYLVRARLH
ncbi:ParB N-terminal domain-containing protein [Marivita sp. S0852]|uniref:ParB N-terminal domain-containing protein n=1 Tax=Marivita sp. S0852 TaxID=3373893 RepID=UPI003982188A